MNDLDEKYLQMQLEKCVYWTELKSSNTVRALNNGIELGAVSEKYHRWLQEYTLSTISKIQNESKFIDYELSEGMRNIFIGRIKSAWNNYINHYGIDYLPKFEGYG